MRLPKHRLYIGQAIVGIQVNKSRNDTTAVQMVVFHLPRGSNRSDLVDLQAISMPNTIVMYPTKNIAMFISSRPQSKRFCRLTWICDHGQRPTFVRQYTMKRCALHCYEDNLLEDRTAGQR
jgi:hypothetical protein